jgi:hypothetical protein
MSDIAENFIPISECPTNFLPFSPISEGPIEALSDIADHGYRTKCPPMLKWIAVSLSSGRFFSTRFEQNRGVHRCLATLTGGFFSVRQQASTM